MVHSPRHLLFMSILMLVILSCGRSSQNTQRMEKGTLDKPTLESTIALKLVPTIDGGVYAMDIISGGVWYVRDGKAIRVSGLEGSIINSVTPTVDGGVYIHVMDEKRNGLWFLKGTGISKVEENDSAPPLKMKMPASSSSSERWLWTLLQSERQQKDGSVRESN